jgi:hypothetical protein
VLLEHVRALEHLVAVGWDEDVVAARHRPVVAVVAVDAEENLALRLDLGLLTAGRSQMPMSTTSFGTSWSTESAE